MMQKLPISVKNSMRENGWLSSLREFFTGIYPLRHGRHAGFNPPRDRVFFFGAGVERDRRGVWLSIAARKMRLMRVW
jgi:hypothetical protein